MKHLVAALMVVLALAAPAAPDTREGSLDGQAAIEIGPFCIAVSREEDKEPFVSTTLWWDAHVLCR